METVAPPPGSIAAAASFVFNHAGDTIELGNITLDFQDNGAIWRWSAVVLPFTVMPDNSIYFLLGMEEGFNSTWEWCGFGGKPESAVETPEHAAAREWGEELLHLGVPGEAQMHQDLVQRNYVASIVTCTNQGASKETPRHYQITFLKQVPFVPILPQSFFLRAGQVHRLAKAHDHYDHMVRELENWEAKHPDCPRFPIYGRDTLHWSLSPSTESDDWIDVQTDRGRLHTFEKNRIYSELISAYHAVRSQFASMTPEVRSLPCITYRVPGAPDITNSTTGLPFVERHFLEKLEVRWFSLYQVEQTFGPTPPITIRRSFHSTLLIAKNILLSRLAPGAVHPLLVQDGVLEGAPLGPEAGEVLGVAAGFPGDRL